MGFSTLLKTTGLAIALALAAFAFYGSDLLFLAKALSLALGASIAFNLALPYVRGVKKGDRVSIVGGSTPMLLPWMFRGGTALTDGKINKEIRIRLDDGKEAYGVVESYDTLLPPLPPKVRILYEERMME